MGVKWLLVLLSLFTFSLQAQKGFTHYTPDQGLPSSEVYDVLCDQKGFIWISTDRGVSRFNGYTFENFYTSDGLTDNIIIEMFEDKQDHIWLSTNSGRLCYYDYADSKIHEYAYNDLLCKHLPSLVVIKSIRLDSSGTLFIGYLHYGAVSVSREGKLSVIKEIPVNTSSHEYKIYFRGLRGQSFVYSFGGVHEKYTTVEVSIELPGIHFNKVLPLSSPRFMDEYMFRRKNGSAVFSIPGYLIEIAPGKEPLILPMNDDVRRILEDRQGRLWICLHHEGLRMYEPDEPLTGTYTTLLPGKYANAICEDREQGIWVGVYNDALYYRPMVNVKVEKQDAIPESRVVTTMESFGGDLYLGTESDRLYRLQNNGVIDSIILPRKHLFYIQALDSSLMLYGYSRYNLYRNQLKDLSEPGKNSIAYVVYKTDSVIYTGTHSTLRRYLARPPYTELPYIRLFPARFEAIYNYRGRMLLGSSLGVFEMKGNTAISCNHWFDKACRTTAILETHGYLVFSTLGEGIRFIHTASGRRFTLNTRNGLLSNNINALCLDGDRLWAAGSFGLNEIRFTRDSFRVYSYTLSNGLKVSEIRQLLVHNQRLWMRSVQGAYSFALSGIVNNTQSIPVHILSVTNADTVYTGAALSGNTEVQFNSILRIRYVGLSYKQYRNIHYRYRLLDKDSDWTYTMNTEVEFAFLAEGHYTFELSASNEDGEWSPPVNFRFFVEPPFWRTWWFIFSIGVLVLALLLSIFIVRIRRLKQESRIREQLYDYRQQALVARMNPHFIFNSLNSIHYFILNEDKGMAGKYLTRFASLMRMTLDFSTREYVTLEEDIHALRLYLELEAWRFKDKFSFRLDMAEGMDAEAIQVPPMLVQPFVENAINHGLLNRTSSDGALNVHYRITGQNLECIVEDNGVGRAEAERLRQYSAFNVYRSAGVSITRQRLETACEKNEQAFLLEYTDKTLTTHPETGTLVRFHIPFTYDKSAHH